jgi:hypothetical protein
MNNIKGKLGILALVGVLFLSGCSKADESKVDTDDLIATPPVAVEPGEGIGETSLAGAEFEAKIEGIKSITLKDIEGNEVERLFTDEEMFEIETAFNESFVMDTAYIEMITGYIMTIELENGEEVLITSYGDPIFIVARVGDGQTYHLGCETIANILLEGMN